MFDLGGEELDPYRPPESPDKGVPDKQTEEAETFKMIYNPGFFREHSFFFLS